MRHFKYKYPVTDFQALTKTFSKAKSRSVISMFCL